MRSEYSDFAASRSLMVPELLSLFPWTLHTQAKAAEKQAARLESVMAERAQRCPFRPETNHQRRQEQLRRILAQPY